MSLEKRSQLVLLNLKPLLLIKMPKCVHLKDTISRAFTVNFEGKGLTVEQRNGKIYVSMENKAIVPVRELVCGV
jgi:chemotaxis protein MotB